MCRSTFGDESTKNILDMRVEDEINPIVVDEGGGPEVLKCGQTETDIDPLVIGIPMAIVVLPSFDPSSACPHAGQMSRLVPVTSGECRCSALFFLKLNIELWYSAQSWALKTRGIYGSTLTA